MKLYITPLSILTLVTWVPQSRLAFGHSARRLAIAPPALAKPNPKVCSLACRWRLRSALRADREFFSIESGPLLDSKALCRQLQVALQLLYPTPPSILTLVTWVQRTQAWPSANSARRLAFGQTESYSELPRLPLAATIGPAGQSRVFFY